MARCCASRAGTVVVAGVIGSSWGVASHLQNLRFCESDREASIKPYVEKLSTRDAELLAESVRRDE